MEFNMQQFLDEIEDEKRDVNIVYKELSQESYRKGVLEGLRLGVVIARNSATADTVEGANLQPLTHAAQNAEADTSGVRETVRRKKAGFYGCRRAASKVTLRLI